MRLGADAFVLADGDASETERDLARVLSLGARCVAVDLRVAPFEGDAALAALLHAGSELTSRGGRLVVVVTASSSLARLLDASSTTTLEVERTLEAALARLDG